MAFHPSQVQWFEARVPRDQTVHALEILAGSQQVELDDIPQAAEPCFDSQALNRLLNSFEQLAGRIPELPACDDTLPERLLLQPVQLAEQALDCLRNWHIRLLDLQRNLRLLKREKANLELLEELLQAIDDSDQLDLRGLDRQTLFLTKHLFACPKAQLENPQADATVSQVIEGYQHDFWFVFSDPQHARLLDGAATLLECQTLKLPAELPPDPITGRQTIANALGHTAASMQNLQALISAHLQDASVRQALANVRLLRWYSRHPLQPDAQHKACRVIGWTLYPQPGEMEQLLSRNGIEAQVVFGRPRAGKSPPVYLSQSRWAKPFHHLLGMAGTPSHQEVDPSPLLAWLVPLLFGFMFPDLGHGLILLVIGLLAKRRYPAAAILISCGLSAALFGLLFGEFFGATGLIPAHLGCPLEQPREILLATLLLGVAIMMLGLLLAGLEAYWRGDIGSWLLEGAPVILLYLSAALALVWPQLLVLCLAAALWYLAGIALLSRRGGLRTLLNRLGQLFESTLQLFINTLSFLRVGAFALAHCALSLMVLQLTQAVENPIGQGMVFLLGQVLIIVLEGLIVTIQTTRLIMFEFFIRFLRFEGRIYKPLSGPERDETVVRDRHK